MTNKEARKIVTMIKWVLTMVATMPIIVALMSSRSFWFKTTIIAYSIFAIIIVHLVYNSLQKEVGKLYGEKE